MKRTMKRTIPLTKVSHKSQMLIKMIQIQSNFKSFQYYKLFFRWKQNLNYFWWDKNKRHCLQISLLILSEFKRISSPLKFSENRRFSEDFMGNKSSLGRLNWFNIWSEICLRSQRRYWFGYVFHQFFSFISKDSFNTFFANWNTDFL